MGYESRRAASRRARLSFLAGTALTALWTSAAVAQTAPAQPAQPPANAPGTAQPVNPTQTPDQQTQAVPPGQAIVITGYRGSLQSSTNAKKRSVGFVDTIFAEDIGKFPDKNVADSLGRFMTSPRFFSPFVLFANMVSTLSAWL